MTPSTDPAGRVSLQSHGSAQQRPDSVSSGWIDDEWNKVSNSFVHLFIHHTCALNLLCARLWDTEMGDGVPELKEAQ